MSTITDSNMPSSNTEADISEALSTFTLFPRLPLELRRKIWQHALPPADRMIVHMSPTEQPWRLNVPRLPSYFSYEPIVITPRLLFQRVPPTSECFVCVCHEARTKYLLANPNLPQAVLPGGRIYYNLGTTIIYIYNRDKMDIYVSARISEDITGGIPLPSWFAGVGSHEGFHNIHVLSNLKEWIGVSSRVWGKVR